MAVIPCAECGLEHQYSNVFQDTPFAGAKHRGDKLRGVLICGDPECEGQTAFEITNNTVSWLPGKDMFGKPSHKDVLVLDMFNEARLSFFGGAYRGTAVMARATLEQALLATGKLKPAKLEVMIEEATDKGILGKREHMLAEGSRLMGNDAIHTAKVVTPVQVQAALAAAAILVNHLGGISPDTQSPQFSTSFYEGVSYGFI